MAGLTKKEREQKERIQELEEQCKTLGLQAESARKQTEQFKMLYQAQVEQTKQMRAQRDNYIHIFAGNAKYLMSMISNLEQSARLALGPILKDEAIQQVNRREEN